MAAAVFGSVAHALEVAHENQVLHLDIKPDDVLINRQGQVKVTDFGLATLADAGGFGAAGGCTIGYMPLEQMRGVSLDARCDEWALASVTYEMLAGENPFQLYSKAPSADYKSFIEGEVRYSSLKRSFPDKADQLFDRAAKIASDRYEHLTKLSKLYE